MMIYPEMELGAFVQLRSGGTPSKSNSEFWGGDIPWVSAKDMYVDRLYSTQDKVSKSAIGKGTRLAPTGSILLVVRGMGLAKVMPIARAMLPIAFNQDVKALKVTSSQVTEDYLFAALRARREVLRGYSDEAAHGTKRIQTDRLLSLPIPIPPLPVQKRIAAILSAYDDLIEVNTRRIAILEEMARRTYEESARAVDSFTTLPEVADITYGHPFRSKLFTEDEIGLGVIRIRDVKRHRPSCNTEELAKPHHIVENGDILIGMDGEFHMSNWAGGRAWLNQRVARLRPCEATGWSKGLLFEAIQRPIQHLNNTIVGTTVAHLSAKDLKALELPAFSDMQLRELNAGIDPMSKLATCLRQTNTNLRAQRDLLLPRLISGKLDVSETETMREAMTA